MESIEKWSDAYTFAHDIIVKARTETKKWKTAFLITLFALIATNALWFIAWIN